ncbi:MAG: YicC/YloC family endoribonuclease, partial [Candidatus Latescibacterota bacterium]
MLISMTGYGHGQVANQAASVSVEIRTVNHRFLDFSIKLPKGLSNREQDVKETIREQLSRGRIAVTITSETMDT